MIILDTNIVLEILEKRDRYHATIRALNRYKREKNAVTTLTLSNVFYMTERHKSAFMTAEKLLKTYKIVGVTPQDAEWAFGHYKGKDFEDALQVAAALREKCTVFLTIDSSLAKKYGKYLAIDLIM